MKALNSTRFNDKRRQSSVESIVPSLDLDTRRTSVNIMVSYCHDIKEKVIEFRNSLINSADLVRSFPQMTEEDIWIDEKNMRTDVMADMYQAIETADIILMMLSTGYPKSKNCMFEAQLSRAQEKRIVPVIVTGDFPFGDSYLEDLIDPSTLRIAYDDKSVINKVISAFRVHSDDLPTKSLPVDIPMNISSQCHRNRRACSAPSIRHSSMTENVSEDTSNSKHTSEVRTFMSRLRSEDVQKIRNLINTSPTLLHALIPPYISVQGRIEIISQIMDCSYTPRV